MKPFEASRQTLGNIDALETAKLIGAFGEIVLVLDSEGTVRDLFLGDKFVDCSRWAGQAWVEVVDTESRSDVEGILRKATSDTPTPWRQINHFINKQCVPIHCSALSIGDGSRVIVVGRDLRPLATLQRRVAEGQALLQRERDRLRRVETRWQALSQLSTEAILTVSASTLSVLEANPTAVRLLGRSSSKLTGRNFLQLIDSDDVPAAQTLLDELRGVSKARELVVHTAQRKLSLSLSACLLPHGSSTCFLLRLAEIGAQTFESNDVERASALGKLLAEMPAGFVIFDDARQILTANKAFLELAQLGSEGQARGEKIERWLGHAALDIDVLIANLNEYGSARRFPTVIRGEYGSAEEIELFGVTALAGDKRCYGLLLYRIEPAIGESVRPDGPTRSLEQLKQLVGRVPLRDLVRETTDMIEQMCIGAALELSRDNRVSAAEMLGLSRQSLYVKLRRHGMLAMDETELP